MHINHKSGDKMMVDWNGTRMYVYDRYTGEAIPAYLFEATLPFSMYSYCLLYTSPSPRDLSTSRMPSSA